VILPLAIMGQRGNTGEAVKAAQRNNIASGVRPAVTTRSKHMLDVKLLSAISEASAG